jgi:protein-L-isoaspartate(D-aspartate) O-methyltransferase
MRVHRVDPIQNARSNMVFAQLKTNGVIDKLILGTLERVPREHFVPVAVLSIAYGDSPVYCDIPGRYLFAPQTLGIFLQHLNLQADDKVLVVGGNYGYTATVLFEMGCKAYIIESHPILVAKCREKLKKYNAVIQSGPLKLGLSEHGLYKAIIIELGLNSIPEPIIDQLQECGRVAICINAGETASAKACVFEKKANMLQEVFTIEANMPPCTEFIEPEGFTF